MIDREANRRVAEWERGEKTGRGGGERGKGERKRRREGAGGGGWVVPHVVIYTSAQKCGQLAPQDKHDAFRL